MNIQYDYDLVSHSTLLLSTPYLETERVLVAGNDVDVTTLKEKKAAIYKGNVTEKYENTKNAVYYDSIEEALRAVDEAYVITRIRTAMLHPSISTGMISRITLFIPRRIPPR